MAKKTKKKKKVVETLTHDEASRKNIPTANFNQSCARMSRRQFKLRMYEEIET
jgi:hypothetical protein